MPQQESFLPLDDALTIHGPHHLEFAPNAYSFTRKREITSEGFWLAVLSAAGIPEAEIETRRRQAIRSYFESQWSLTPANPLSQAILDDNIVDLTPDWPACVHQPESVYSTTRQADVDRRFYIFNVAASIYRLPPYALDVHDIKEGCVIRVPLANGQARWYQPLLENGTNAPRPATKTDFALAEWPVIWDRVAELVHVFFDRDPGAGSTNPTRGDVRSSIEAAARTGFSAIDIVRADAALVEQQYIYLDNDLKLARQLGIRADKLLTDAIPAALISTLPALIFQYRELNSHLPRVETLRRRLADAASDIGYKLFLETTPVKYVNDQGQDQVVDLAPGTLFKEGQRTVSWITYQTVTETQKSLFRKRTRSYQVPIEHRKTFTYYERAAVDYDPWTEVAEAYRQRAYNVYLFRETSQGLVTADNSSIDEIMRQCREDETFRMRCVIGVPFYEYTIIGEKLLVGYVLLVRPLPEISPAEFPSIHVYEQLTYKFAWQGVALGELAASIPLAPGEERTVTVAVSQRFETSRTITTSSLSEVTRVDKSDFETVFEKEVRREKEATSTAGGSVGGSYAGFSGSANFSQSTTTRDMSRQLNRAVQRASQELTRRSKEETTISVTEKTETTTSTTTAYKLKNINEGRTLNINFYRLMNNYKSNLYLKDFDFSVEAGRDIVMGTGLREARTFSRTELERLWDYFLVPGVMPIDVADKKELFKAVLCEELAKAMTKEYAEQSTSSESRAEALRAAFQEDRGGTLRQLRSESDSGIPVLVIPRIVREVLSSSVVAKDDLGELLRLLAATFRTANCEYDGFLNRSFDPADFSYDSGNLHADAQVGLHPATEEYSENMRRLEERGKEADQRLVAARANYLNSRAAKNLISLEQIIDRTKVYATDRNVLKDATHNLFLRLRLSTELLPSDAWVVRIKDGGSYFQNSTPTTGVVQFQLPWLYGEAPWFIDRQQHQWFANNVSVRHEGLKLTLNYRPPTT